MEIGSFIQKKFFLFFVFITLKLSGFFTEDKEPIQWFHTQDIVSMKLRVVPRWFWELQVQGKVLGFSWLQQEEKHKQLLHKPTTQVKLVDELNDSVSGELSHGLIGHLQSSV